MAYTKEPNPYQEQALAHKVDGYFFFTTRDHASEAEAFEEAKKELLVHLRNDIRVVEEMDFDRFSHVRFGMKKL